LTASLYLADRSIPKSTYFLFTSNPSRSQLAHHAIPLPPSSLVHAASVEHRPRCLRRAASSLPPPPLSILASRPDVIADVVAQGSTARGSPPVASFVRQLIVDGDRARMDGEVPRVEGVADSIEHLLKALSADQGGHCFGRRIVQDRGTAVAWARWCHR
jgi:hypothetical protein